MPERARAARNAFIRAAVPIACIVGGLVAAFYRFYAGLGASTALTDDFPWGVWIGMDLVGIALSGGGFVIAFVVYILGKNAYQGVARSGILVAMLGYPLVVSVLVLDLGQPLRFWHALVFWNHHSAMFEVTVCVTFYTGVLFLEFAPEILAALGRRSLGERLHRAMPLVAGLGIVLSTLHQSSLGTLYLLVPTQMHPLWFSPFLPIHFWASAIQGGLAMVIVIHGFMHTRSGSELEPGALLMLGRYLRRVLSVLLALRILELALSGALDAWSRYEGTLLALELGLGSVLPLILLSRARERLPRIYIGALFTVLGIALNRFNVTITAMEGYHRHVYMPSTVEVLTSLMILSAGVSLYALLARFLDLFPPHPGPRIPLLDAYGVRLLSGAGIITVVALGVAATAEPGPVAGRLPNAPRDQPPPISLASEDSRALAAHGAGPVLLSETSGVIFPHEPHIMGCPACHVTDYTILPGTPHPTGEGHLRAICGRCHDGRQAFSMAGSCVLCHAAVNGIPAATNGFRHAERDPVITCESCHAAIR